MLPDYFISFCTYNLTVHIENKHTRNTESNPFNKPKRDTMS